MTTAAGASAPGPSETAPPQASNANANANASASQASSKDQTIMYTAERIIGNGSFGVVFRALVMGTGEVVAIKKVLQDKRFKNRELQLMRRMQQAGNNGTVHPNIVRLINCFYSPGEKGADELYLNLVLEYVPETVYGVTRDYAERREPVPVITTKVFTYQLCRALAYIHALGICHRDIKPQNLLVDPVTHVLKLCDFGSAKQLVAGEPNVSYICSRYYRAPELIFGSTQYTVSIDTWSLGCVAAELMLRTPLFPGRDCVEQLVEIFQVLGTPSREDIEAMNPNYTDFRFTTVPKRQWNANLTIPNNPTDLIDLVSRTLAYSPLARVTPLEACVHPAFDELRLASAKLPNGRPLPSHLFEFTNVELAVKPEINERLVAHQR